MKCRHCGEELVNLFIDLGSAPPSNSYLTSRLMQSCEKWYPLRVLVCDKCWLVQTEDFVEATEMFSDDYAYFSSFSTTYKVSVRIFLRLTISMNQRDHKNGSCTFAYYV